MASPGRPASKDEAELDGIYELFKKQAGELQRIKQELKAERAARAKAEGGIQELKAEHEAELVKLRAALSASREETQAAAAEASRVQQVQRQLDALQSEIASLRSERSALISAASHAEGALERLKEQVIASEARLQQSQQDGASLLQYAQQLEAAYNNSRHVAGNAERALSTMVVAAQRQGERLSRLLRDSDACVIELVNMLSSAQISVHGMADAGMAASMPLGGSLQGQGAPRAQSASSQRGHTGGSIALAEATAAMERLKSQLNGSATLKSGVPSPFAGAAAASFSSGSSSNVPYSSVSDKDSSSKAAAQPLLSATSPVSPLGATSSPSKRPAVVQVPAGGHGHGHGHTGRPSPMQSRTLAQAADAAAALAALTAASAVSHSSKSGGKHGGSPSSSLAAALRDSPYSQPAAPSAALQQHYQQHQSAAAMQQTAATNSMGAATAAVVAAGRRRGSSLSASGERPHTVGAVGSASHSHSSVSSLGDDADELFDATAAAALGHGGRIRPARTVMSAGRAALQKSAGGSSGNGATAGRRA